MKKTKTGPFYEAPCSYCGCSCCSKKDSELRHAELLSHISPALTQWLSVNCQQLMADHLNHSLVLSVMTHCNSMYHLCHSFVLFLL